MNFNAMLRWRYATKKFDPDRSVDDAIVESILESGNLTASSYGLQPYQFVLLSDRKLREGLVASSYGQRQVVDSSHLIVIAIRTDVDESYIRNFTRLKELERNLPTGSMNSYAEMMMKSILAMDPDDRLQWAARQSYIALGTMMAACAVAQVDACPMEGFSSKDYNSKLDLPSRNLHAQLLLPIGYRSTEDETQHQAKVRRPFAESVIRL
jgi:nitroreductase / dihydropteridine reductase